MKRHQRWTAIIIGTVLVAIGAQNPTGTAGNGSPAGSPKSDTAELTRTVRWLREHKNDKLDIEQLRLREFHLRVAAFAKEWNKLMTLGTEGIWDVKQARLTRIAFERLIHSSGWVEK